MPSRIMRFVSVLCAVAVLSAVPALAQAVFINEIHYDNTGGDTGEAIEIAGPAGTDLTGWDLVLYNGNGGAPYNTNNLSGTIPNQQSGFGTLSFSYPSNGIQNGAPDGIALVNGGSVVQFLSYEGTMTAVGGPADGMMSTDINVSESSGTAVGDSLQLGGTGTVATDFTWQTELPNTFGGINANQSFGAGDAAPSVVSTTPSDGAGGIALDADITIDFSEAVNVAGTWFDVTCGTSGNHPATVSGGPVSFTLDPDTDFVNTETCTVTVFSSQVTDVDADDPPDNMAADFVFSFSTLADVELVINEVDYDQPSSDTAEFVELRNNDAGSVSLAGFSLELVNGTGGGSSVYQTIALPAVTLGPGDYYVVCGDFATVSGCDLEAINSIQNGAPDAVALVLGGSIVDTVSYEGDTGAPYTEGSGAGLEDPGTGGVGGGNDNKSISRLPDGTDTDVNNADFSTVCATPGAANTTDSSDCPSVAPPSLKVNEIDYDQPGGDTAEFIEIVNSGQGDADLTGATLELVNGSNGSVYQTVALPAVTLMPGDYFVVCSDATTVANCDLEALSSIQNGSPDAVALVLDGLILDTVSYEGDTAAPYTEGSGSGLEDSGSAGQDFRSIGRFPDGVDTNVNNVDLINACITPGGPNTSLTTACSSTAPILEIYEIQGAGTASPFDGQSIRTENNVVTVVGTDRFAIQTPTARTDGDIDTSDGIIVFTGSPPSVAVGDIVNVSGAIDEFFGLTEYASGSLVELVSPGGTVPAPVVFDATVPSPDPSLPSCSIEFECYEGMLVEIAQGSVTGPNQAFGGFNPDPIAEVHITAAPMRTFREPGIEFPGIPPFAVWDGNPEVFELDPDKLGLANQIIPAGSSFSATGVIGFEFFDYELWPSVLSVTPATIPMPVRPRAAGEFTVGSLNLFRFFDHIDDPPSMNFQGGTRDDDGDTVSMAEYDTRRAKFVDYIVNVLDSPDVLAVQEAEKLEVLEALAADIAVLDPTVVYTAYLEEGNDVGTIDVGFLVRDTIQVDSVSQIDPTATFVDPSDMSVDILHDRPPLLLEGTCIEGSVPIKVIGVHNRSLGGIDGSQGVRVRQKRFEQAKSITAAVEGLQTADPDVKLVVTGDFNAFQFSDGYVDAIGVITGDFVAAENLICDTNDCTMLADPDLTNQIENLAAAEQYSFIFNGNAQVLDHVLTSQGLTPLVTDTQFGRGNTDAAEDLINDSMTPLASSDHDGLVVFITKDSDMDGVVDSADFCPGTVIPEGVPTVRLGFFRYALTDGDTTFDTRHPFPWLPEFTTEDTAGCSCEQILDELPLHPFVDRINRKFGCSIWVMNLWSHLVDP